MTGSESDNVTVRGSTVNGTIEDYLQMFWKKIGNVARSLIIEVSLLSVALIFTDIDV